MIREPEAPDGYRVARAGRGWFLSEAGQLEALRRLGLDRPEGWAPLLSGGGAGRGATGRLELAGGRRLRLKQLRRGGWTAGLWRDRFVGSGRLLANLTVPLAAAERGVPTPKPAALLLLEGPRGLTRGWLATEELFRAEDLAARLAAGRPPSPSELARVAAVVRRMHDAGIEHRDLNLGNLVLAAVEHGEPVAGAKHGEPVAGAKHGEPVAGAKHGELVARAERGELVEPFVVDLDRARLHPGPLPFRYRQRALRRIERSQRKLDWLAGRPASVDADSWYRCYAGTDAALARRLARGRRWGDVLIRFHRLGWRRSIRG